MSAIGIDFGTTNSVVAKWQSGEVEVLQIDSPPLDWAGLGFDRVLPTVVGLEASDTRHPVFGWDARQAEHRVAAVKRLIATEESLYLGNIEFPVEELATMVFAKLRQGAADYGVDVQRAVVTVPANSRGLARYRTKLCAGMAGVVVPALINEPTAAAMAHSRAAAADETLLVVDWGGGTLDVTILQNVHGVFIEQASKGIGRLGGLDFDRSIKELLTARLPKSEIESWSPGDRVGFELDVERAKILLSEQEETNVPMPGGHTERVTRSEFEAAIRDKVDPVRALIEKCIAEFSKGVRDIDAVVLVGGTCNVPLVRQAVREATGIQPAETVNPMTAIAEGAAVAAAVLAGELDDLDFFVSTEHALGTLSVGASGSTLEFSELIPRNHKLPARATNRFVPVVDYQDVVEFTVIEGDPDEPLNHPDNVVLKAWEIGIPDPGLAGDKAFDVTYEYDVDGILHVNVVDVGTGSVLHKSDVSYAHSLEKRDLVRISKRSEETVSTGQMGERPADTSSLSEEVKLLLHRARVKVMPFVDEEDAAMLRELVERVEEGDSGAEKELDDRLSRYNYLF